MNVSLGFVIFLWFLFRCAFFSTRVYRLFLCIVRWLEGGGRITTGKRGRVVDSLAIVAVEDESKWKRATLYGLSGKSG